MGRKSFFGGLAFLLLIGAFMLLPTSRTAHAASRVPHTPNCYGLACNGLDPVDQGCDVNSSFEGMQDIRDNNNKIIGTVTLEYSHPCDNWWGYLTSFQPTKIQTFIWNAVYLFQRVYGAATDMYSYMVYDGATRSTKCVKGTLFFPGLVQYSAMVCHGP
jgi:hypothetical protein